MHRKGYCQCEASIYIPSNRHIVPEDISPYVRESIFDGLHPDLPSTAWGEIKELVYIK